MRIKVSTHQGLLYDEEVDYIGVEFEDGDFGIYENHIPILAVMNEGYIKLVHGKDVLYVVVISGVFEFNNNEASILAQEAFVGRDKEHAKANILAIRKDRLEANRKESVDLAEKERELRENLKKANAGSL